MSDDMKIDGRTREARAMKVETPRRRRRADNLGPNYRLGTHGDMDREAYEYRWINDDERGRLHRQTVNDDWDIVTRGGDGVTAEQGDKLGDAVRVVVGGRKDGQPMHAYLCRKPKALAEQDRAAKMRPLDEIESAIHRNKLFDGNKPVEDGAFYSPS